MRTFSVKTRAGTKIFGLGLDTEDASALARDGRLLISLESANLGLWHLAEDGVREILAPENSYVLLVAGDDYAAISKAIGVNLATAVRGATVEDIVEEVRRKQLLRPDDGHDS